MPTIVDHLSNAAKHLRIVLFDLDLALKHAISKRYASTWIAAIKQALADTETASRQITNTLKCLAPFSDPPE